MSNNRKAIWNTAIFTGTLYFIMSLAVLIYLKIPNALFFAALAGVLFTLMVAPFMSIALKRAAKKYVKFDAALKDKTLFKANGNIESWKPVRNGNMYVTAEGIILASFDKRPHMKEFIPKEKILFIQPERIRLYIYTDDKKVISFLTQKVPEIMKVIKENGWAAEWSVSF